jgi:uncharacterized membrane protein YczE/cytidylate kinase
MIKIKTDRSAEEIAKRYLSFIVALFIIALGTSMSIRANLGSSPISCPPYVLSLTHGARLTMGQFTICMHIFFIAAQILMLRKNYPIIQLLQIAVSFLFGFYTDLTMWITGLFQFGDTPIDYVARALQLCVGGGLLAYGISFEVHCDALMLAGEGFPLAIAKVTKAEFGKVKMCSDTGLVAVGVVFMFIFFGKWHWEMIGAGTLFSMFYVGFMVRKFSPHFNWLETFFNKNYQTPLAAPAPATGNSPMVVTISREFGSCGHIIGEQLAQRLGIKLYDKDLIDETAKEMGCSSEFVAENEQNISTAKLWELVFTDNSIPESMNPSKDDAIFVAQSRTIMRIAERQPCVIVGRCANWILRNHKNKISVFVFANHDFEIKKTMKLFNLNENDARKKVELTNTARANHYWKYTGKDWRDAKSYDLIVNTAQLSPGEVVDILYNKVKPMLK